MRNVSYYVIAHAAKFVPAGSVRIGSNETGNISSVAFQTKDKKFVLIAFNEGKTEAKFNLEFKNKTAGVKLPAGAVGTYVWK